MLKVLNLYLRRPKGMVMDMLLRFFKTVYERDELTKLRDQIDHVPDLNAKFAILKRSRDNSLTEGMEPSLEKRSKLE